MAGYMLGFAQVIWDKVMQFSREKENFPYMSWAVLNKLVYLVRQG